MVIMVGEPQPSDVFQVPVPNRPRIQRVPAKAIVPGEATKRELILAIQHLAAFQVSGAATAENGRKQPVANPRVPLRTAPRARRYETSDGGADVVVGVRALFALQEQAVD